MSQVIENLEKLTNPDNFQKYVLGYKKNGQPRAAYDVIKDVYIEPKKKKKKKHDKNNPYNTYSFYMNAKKKKKKHKKKNKKFSWHI